MEKAHDWRTVRETGRLQLQRRAHDHETGGRRVIATYPDPLPADCPGAHNFTPTAPQEADGRAGQKANRR